jgi:outer membrane protein assembly factor BamB
MLKFLLSKSANFFLSARLACLCGLHLLAAPAIAGEPCAKAARSLSVSASVSSRAPYALSFRTPLVRRGFFREVQHSFGQPALVPQLQRVVVGTGSGDIVGLDSRTGQVVWRRAQAPAYEAAASVVTPPQAQPYVLLGSRSGELVGLDPADGTALFVSHVEADVRAPARQQGDKIFVSTAANQVVGLNAYTGAQLWTQGRPPPTGLTVEGHARPAVDAERVYATFSDGYAVAMDLKHGATLWARPLSQRGGPFVDADADPVVTPTQLFVASYADGVYALAKDSGATLWNTPLGAVISLLGETEDPLGAEPLLFVGSADGDVWALRQSDGSQVYHVHAGRVPISRFALHRGSLLFTAGHMGLVMLDARTGRPQQVTPVGEQTLGDPAVAGNFLSFLTGSGHLLGFARDASAPSLRLPIF